MATERLGRPKKSLRTKRATVVAESGGLTFENQFSRQRSWRSLRQETRRQTKHSMEKDSNPYLPPTDETAPKPLPVRTKQHRGPLLYFALSGIIGASLAIPLIVPRSLAVEDDPNPIGYLLILLSFPVGGLIYRIRSRNWPVDETVRQRQRTACFVTLLLPVVVAFLTGLRAQGLHMTILSGFVSLVLIAGILVSGKRRGRPVA